MLNMTAVPDDVVLGILEHTMSVTPSTLNTWKTMIPLLAVCRQWRYCGQPLLSKTAVLMYNEAAETWSTNIPVIQAIGNTRWIKTVIVKVHKAQLLGAMMGQLNVDGVAWKNAKSLCIIVQSFTTPETSPIPMDVEPAEQPSEKQIHDIADAFVGHLPNVTMVHITGASANNSCHEFLNVMSRAYANQLTEYSGSLSALVLTPQLFDNLIALTLDFNYQAVLLPEINPERIKCLNLTNIPSDIIWQKFVAENAQNNDIWFTNLEHLSLAYQTNYSEHNPAIKNNDGHFRIYCPQLKKLVAKNIPPGSPILLANTTSTLKCMDITDDQGRIEPVMFNGHRHVEKLVVSTSSSHSFTEKFCQSLNNIFGTKCKAKYTSLCFWFSSPIPDPEMICWPQLCKLSIFSNIPSDIVLYVLAKLPNLDELSLASIFMRNWMPEQLENGAVVSTSITKVSYYDIYAPDDNGSTEFLKYLLIAIPSLCNFTISEKHQKSVFEFITEMVDKYPRLTTIKYGSISSQF